MYCIEKQNNFQKAPIFYLTFIAVSFPWHTATVCHNFVSHFSRCFKYHFIFYRIPSPCGFVRLFNVQLPGSYVWYTSCFAVNSKWECDSYYFISGERGKYMKCQKLSKYISSTCKFSFINLELYLLSKNKLTIDLIMLYLYNICSAVQIS